MRVLLWKIRAQWENRTLGPGCQTILRAENELRVTGLGFTGTWGLLVLRVPAEYRTGTVLRLSVLARLRLGEDGTLGTCRTLGCRSEVTGAFGAFGKCLALGLKRLERRSLTVLGAQHEP